MLVVATPNRECSISIFIVLQLLEREMYAQFSIHLLSPHDF
jgi:hypothetical protein